jgi:hypothetical protein
VPEGHHDVSNGRDTTNDDCDDDHDADEEDENDEDVNAAVCVHAYVHTTYINTCMNLFSNNCSVFHYTKPARLAKLAIYFRRKAVFGTSFEGSVLSLPG